MSLYLCPRSDLRCHSTFGTTGELDQHLREIHRYTHLGAFRTTMRPVKKADPPPAAGQLPPSRPAGQLPAGERTTPAGL
jgi:hypothetical protein